MSVIAYAVTACSLAAAAQPLRLIRIACRGVLEISGTLVARFTDDLAAFTEDLAAAVATSDQILWA
jgi:hypothetical protein